MTRRTGRSRYLYSSEASLPPAHILELLPWGEIYKQAVTFAYVHLGPARNMELAKEIAQEAIRQLIEPESADWTNFVDEHEARRAIGSRINGLISNHWRKHYNIRTDLTSDAEVFDRVAAYDGADPEAAVSERQERARAMTLLLERVAEDEFLTRLLLECPLETPGQQARILGCDEETVYVARRRLTRHLSAVRATLNKRN